MYLITLNNQLLGYTYNKIALAAFLQVCREQSIYPTYKECSDALPTKEGFVKTKEHIENLVNWYSRQPNNTIYYHHYIRLNTNLITSISYEFREKLHEKYYKLFMTSLIEDLNSLLRH